RLISLLDALPISTILIFSFLLLPLLSLLSPTTTSTPCSLGFFDYHSPTADPYYSPLGSCCVLLLCWCYPSSFDDGPCSHGYGSSSLCAVALLTLGVFLTMAIVASTFSRWFWCDIRSSYGTSC